MALSAEPCTTDELSQDERHECKGSIAEVMGTQSRPPIGCNEDDNDRPDTVSHMISDEIHQNKPDKQTTE